MPSGLSFVVCKTMNDFKDFLVLKVLQAIVKEKEKDSRFLFGRRNEQEAGPYWIPRGGNTWAFWFRRRLTARCFVRCSSSRMNGGRSAA